MKRFYIILIMVLFATLTQAQFYNDGTMTNNNNLVSDWQNQWFNTATGIYDGVNGIFEHHGPSSLTFVNNGTYNATAGHTDQFLGPLGANGAQEIAGSTRPFFFNLLLNNGATDQINITNTDGANVRNTATFSNGITTTVRNNHQTGALRFGDGATYTGGNTDAQHVNGYTSKIGDDAFIFPVGSGTDIRSLSVTAPAVASEVSVAWFAGSPSSVTDPSDGAVHPISSVTTPIISVSPAGFWDWISVSGSDDNQVITASIPDMSAFAITSNLRLIGWNGSSWIDLSGSANASGNTENSTLTGTIPAGTSITAIAIGSTSVVLPLQWESFTITEKQGCMVQLDWSTSWEENTAYYEVQQSGDGSLFTSIARVTAAGHSSLVKNYRALDRNPFSGTSYYRIKQVDLDGRSSYSEIRRLANTGCKGEQNITVYPTVTNTAITIQLPKDYERALVRVLNIRGQVMTVQVQGSGLYRYVRMNTLPSGIYIVQVVDEKTNRISNHKVVVQ